MTEEAKWNRLKANIPTVVVRDLLVHPRENDLVIGTYGRAVWIGDISPSSATHKEYRRRIFTFLILSRNHR
ncbi:MAG: hypothetical protein R2727_11200 [Bacteroidales bacterium]